MTILSISLFGDYQSKFKEIENKKEGLANQYKIRIELAKLDENELRFKLLSKTYMCIQSSRSSSDIENCKKSEQKRVLYYVDKKSLKNRKNFFIKKNELLSKYKFNKRKTKLKNKEYILSKAINCLENSKNHIALRKCLDTEKKDVDNFLLSFKDNPKTKKLSVKEDLIDRYKIRLQSARLNRLYHHVSVFTKTLECFKSSRTRVEIDYCKKNEENRIIKLIKS